MTISDRPTPLELDVWAEPAMLHDATRHVARLPRSQVVQEAFADHISPMSTVVEFGSGTGVLAGLTNSFANFVHVDGSRAMIDTHKSNQPEAIHAQADLYRLPFASDSVDAAAGMLVIDAMLNPTEVFEEVERVLKPGGKLLYFHDLAASTNALARVIRSSGDIPIPLSDQGNRVDAIGMLGARDFRRLKKMIRADLGRDAEKTFQSMLVDTPPAHFDHWNFEEMEMVTYLTAAFSEIFGDEHKTPHVSEAFMNLMASMAVELGMSLDEVGVRDAEIEVPKQEVEDFLDEKFADDENVFAQTIWGAQWGTDPKLLNRNKARVVTVMGVMAATKKQ